MPVTAISQSGWSFWISPALFIAALATSLFFQGFEIDLFSIAQLLLLSWLLRVLWQSYDNGFTVRQTGPAIALTLFWVWLGITVAWSRVPYVSVMNFWWLGSLPLAFWIYTLAPDRERIWHYLAGFVLLMGLALALMAVYQSLVLHEAPRSVFININLHAALLNLIALPSAGYFLAVRASEKRRSAPTTFLALAYFTLVFAVALTGGRGAMIALILGVILLMMMAARHVPKGALGALLALTVAAFMLANLRWEGAAAESLEVLLNPTSTIERFLIWEQAWEMLKASPWWGIGLGTFTLVYPQYRHPDDSTAGFFAHNDYLQIWIEAGLPGLLLLLAILLSVLWTFVQAMRKGHSSVTTKIEMAGLFSGLFATALHSLVTFNLYVIPTLLISGVMLARLNALATPPTQARCWQLRPSKWLGSRAYRTTAVLLIMFPLAYFASIGLCFYETNKGIEQGKQGMLIEAEKSLARAARLYPYADNVLISLADLYRHSLTLLPDAIKEEQARLFDDARALLERAERLNPLRPLNYLVRATLYQENPRLAGEDWAEQTERAYQHALGLNPRFYKARVAYAEFLLASGKEQQARQILEEGIHHRYHPRPAVLPYYVLTAKLRWRAGDITQANALGETIDDILRSVGSETRFLELIKRPAAFSSQNKPSVALNRAVLLPPAPHLESPI